MAKSAFEAEVEQDLEVPEIEEDKSQSPLITAAQLKFVLTRSEDEVSHSEKQLAQLNLVKLLTEKRMLAYYQACCKQLGWMEDEKLVTELSETIAKELKEWDAKIEDAKANLGESEVREALTSKAHFVAMTGTKEEAVQAFKDAMEKTPGSGLKIDLVFWLIRLGILWGDKELVASNIVAAKGHVEKGGDWERRNLLAVYEAVYGFITRDFKTSSKKLLDSVATFTCYELFDYTTFVTYTVLAAIVAQGRDRVLIKEKLVYEPEILQVIHEVPHLKETLMALYSCNYPAFFPSLLGLTERLQRDLFLAPHIAYIMREARLVIYSQFLASYKGVSLNSMAKSFGVTPAFLDKELSRFIAAGKLPCKIDKVDGVVETARQDSKSQQYAKLVHQGDTLLSRVQKLTKLVSN